MTTVWVSSPGPSMQIFWSQCQIVSGFQSLKVLQLQILTGLRDPRICVHYNVWRVLRFPGFQVSWFQASRPVQIFRWKMMEELQNSRIGSTISDSIFFQEFKGSGSGFQVSKGSCWTYIYRRTSKTKPENYQTTMEHTDRPWFKTVRSKISNPKGNTSALKAPNVIKSVPETWLLHGRRCVKGIASNS